MKLPINWPWHRVCTGGALSMRSVSFVLHERERNEEVVVASPAKRRMRIKVSCVDGKSILKDSRKALEGVDITQVVNQIGTLTSARQLGTVQLHNTNKSLCRSGSNLQELIE